MVLGNGASKPRSAESVKGLGGAEMREPTPSCGDQKAWPRVLDTMVNSSGVSRLALARTLMVLVFNKLRSTPSARRVVCSGKQGMTSNVRTLLEHLC